jgi:queuosine precursor transporter
MNIWTLAYLAAVVAVNASFILVRPLVLGNVVLTVGSLLVGGVLVLRDCAQRAQGHRVLWAMGAGIAITALMSPALALASGGAFAASEGVEWLLFTVTRKPFRERVALSASCALVVDSAAFLLLAGFWGWGSFLAMCASKGLALLLVPLLPDPMGVARG